MTAYEDYILQTFHDKDGNPETNKPKECRICWIKNGYPPFEELANICNSTLKTIQKYSSIYNWKSIRRKAGELKAAHDLEKQRQRQEKALTDLDAINELRIEELNNQLKQLQQEIQKDYLTEEDRKEIRQEIRLIIKDMHLVQKDKLRTVNLPDKINDKQDHHFDGNVEHKGLTGLAEAIENSRKQ